MNQETVDQGWQQLQSRINQLVGQFLREDFPIIEYKPRSIALLQMPSDYKSENAENIS
jgi:hypothetical protein